MVDPIADALIRIKNGYMAGVETVNIKYSKTVFSILKLLEKEGFVGNVKQKNNEVVISLKYVSRKPAMTGVKRISKPSLRIYSGVKNLPKVVNGLGCAIISTPKGIMTHMQARKLNVGGEVLALVW